MYAYEICFAVDMKQDVNIMCKDLPYRGIPKELRHFVRVSHDSSTQLTLGMFVETLSHRGINRKDFEKLRCFDPEPYALSLGVWSCSMKLRQSCSQRGIGGQLLDSSPQVLHRRLTCRFGGIDGLRGL